MTFSIAREIDEIGHVDVGYDVGELFSAIAGARVGVEVYWHTAVAPAAGDEVVPAGLHFSMSIKKISTNHHIFLDKKDVFRAGFVTSFQRVQNVPSAGRSDHVRMSSKDFRDREIGIPHVLHFCQPLRGS